MTTRPNVKAIPTCLTFPPETSLIARAPVPAKTSAMVPIASAIYYFLSIITGSSRTLSKVDSISLGIGLSSRADTERKNKFSMLSFGKSLTDASMPG